ncbi:MAG: SufE family protein [Planctomycetota bacterium]|jgi:cysteine desulfuration protein SufE
MTATNTPSLDDIVTTFEFFDSWEDRFMYLIDMGKKLPPLDEADMVEANRVHGCQATVYLKETVNPDNTITIAAHANAHIVNGLITIVKALYSGKTAAEILETDTAPTFTALGLEEHLSPTRRNGLHAMVKRIRALAEQIRDGVTESAPAKVELPQVGAAAAAPPDVEAPLEDNSSATLYERVLRATQTVFDPEIPVNIYELGLIYNIDINPVTHVVNIEMTLTTPNCPEAQSLPLSVEQAVAAVEGVTEANVSIVWEPMWNKDMMSDSAKLQLGFM